MESDHIHRRDAIIIALAVIIFLAVIFRAAYICDDAYIPCRTVENFLHGYGLTYNVGDRVQSFTHPLWMFLISAVYFVINGLLRLSFLNQLYYIAIGLNLVCSLATILIFAFGVVKDQWAAICGVILLALSKAFTDYSTSGLENALTHLLLVVFCYLYQRGRNSDAAPDVKSLFWLTLIAAFGFLNRMDTLLLYLPVLIVAFVKAFKIVKWKAIRTILLGALPALAWLVFSVIYYGFPFPNTYYAKLTTGISAELLIRQGVLYFINSLQVDPLTLVVITLALVVPFILKRSQAIPLLVGVVLYLLYVVKIGGDFMSGRFFAAPFLLAVIYLACVVQSEQNKVWAAVLAAALLLSLGAPASPLWGNGYIGQAESLKEFVSKSGIADERAFYFKETGLVNAARNVQFPDSLYAGRKWIKTSSGVALLQRLGFEGYAAGPNAHVLEAWALADPLLAHLPVADPVGWRIGHFARTIPDGYIETLETGKNQILNPDLAAYYDRLALVVKGDIFAPGRFAEILRLNTGYYNDLIQKYHLTEAVIQ